MNRESIAHSADSAAFEAVKIGFPVVLKACGASLFHKTEVGGVVLGRCIWWCDRTGSVPNSLDPTLTLLQFDFF